MKFFSRRQRQEPRGLYRQDKPADEMAVERKKIQKHNVEVLLGAEGLIREMPLFFSNDQKTGIIPIPLPDLWCNSSERKDADKGRFQLVFITKEPDRKGNIEAKLSIADLRKQKLAAIRDWDVRFLNGKYVQIRSSLDVTLGYEGNGYATALLRLNDAAVETIIEAILRNQTLAMSKQARAVPWFSVVSDAAVSTTEDFPNLPRRDDVPLSRQLWTSQTMQKYSPDFFDRQELERRLGFAPDDTETKHGDFFKIYR